MEKTTHDRSGMVTGLFYDRPSAERAYEGLTSRGYTRDDINVVMSEDARKKHFSDDAGTQTELGTKAAEGAGVGGAIGGTLGAVLAAVAATGTSIAIPGLGLVVAGPLAAAAAGAGAGAMTGGLIGALVGWGIPEERVKHYESGLQQGGMLLGVRPRTDEDASYIEQHWRDSNGMHIYRPNASTGSIASGGDQTDEESHAVVAVYDNYEDASSAVQALVADGFSQDRVQLNPEQDTTITQKSVTSDSAARGNTGGITGFFENLFGVDNSTEYRDTYAESVRRGSFVLTVDSRNAGEAERAGEILERFNPVDVDARVSHWKNQGWSGYDAAAPTYSRDDIERERASYLAPATNFTSGRQSESVDAAVDAVHIPVVEEQVNIGKREVERGRVRIIKRVIERPVQEQVTLRDEHIHVERRPVDRPVSGTELDTFQESSFEVRETDEEAVVAKTAKVVEELVIGKEVTEHTEQINETVRRTDIDVERLGSDASLRTDAETHTMQTGRNKPSRDI